jgi:hypothetical protein
MQQILIPLTDQVGLLSDATSTHGSVRIKRPKNSTYPDCAKVSEVAASNILKRLNFLTQVLLLALFWIDAAKVEMPTLWFVRTPQTVFVILKCAQ